ncbi:MAG: class I SAM-dependent methyltransferase [Clostridiaceae bacterium]|jgi:16S rRNA G1207 methylase RsmC|nr:class I SAM-dependent methyltransferase [Clostridiaceae bacterium]
MDHYYSEKPKSEIQEHKFSYEIKGIELEFTSVSGVFAFSQKVDKASRLLIESFKPSGAGNFVLDMGCGIGPISLYIKSKYPHLQVTAVDINERAVFYTEKNAKLNNLSIEAMKSDLYSQLEGRLFWDILSNPPIAAGKALNTRLISESKTHLLKNGSLWLVAFHNKGGETLKRIMNEVFGNVEDIEKKGGIRVYRSVNI